VQDLGPERDQELAVYYAKTQPDRTFYRFDRHHGTIVPLGKPEDFLASLRRMVAEARSHPPASQDTAR
jgi:hypothetical protein